MEQIQKCMIDLNDQNIWLIQIIDESKKESLGLIWIMIKSVWFFAIFILGRCGKMILDFEAH